MNHLKAAAVVLGICILGFLGWQVWQAKKGSEPAVAALSAVQEMEKSGVPVLSGKDIFGDSFSTESFKGKILVINFWASWCGPCVQEVPSLINLVKEFKGKIQVLALSEDNNLEDIQIFLKSFPDFKNKNTVIVWDSDHSFMKNFSVQALPESFVVDGNSKLVKKISGSIDWNSKEAQQYMRELLGEKP